MRIEDQEHPWRTVEGFLVLYSKYLAPDKSFKSAYDAAEEEFQKRYNHPRYANYQTFMRARSQYRKIRQRKTDNGRQAA